jgi:acetyltransferase-like isoleucine patch superfamily enzyme
MKNQRAFKERVTGFLKNNKFLYGAAMVLLRRKPVLNSVRKQIHGTGNAFKFSGTAIFANCMIDIAGDNNSIEISEFCVFRNVTFLIRGNNNKITIGRAVRFGYGGSLHMEDDHGLIDIGNDSTFEDAHLAVTESGSQILIGDDCMFAYDVDLRTGDSHSILDTRTNTRINPPGNVQIADHVWVAPHCTILKGVEIQRNSIVATRSVVTGSWYQEGVIIGGSPARILKENITWDRRRIAIHEVV